MDKETIDTYNRKAESVAQLHSTLTPHRIYELINRPILYKRWNNCRYWLWHWPGYALANSTGIPDNRH